jgi:16S rRNA (cytosine967-C5)-methyltransferase
VSTGSAVRAAAARTLGAVMRGSTLEQALQHAPAVPERDRALLRELCYGTLRAAPRLQGLLRQLQKRPFKRRDRELEALCLLGLYQLDVMRTPDHAAVSATVDAAPRIGHGRARGLVNAVLRRFLREREALAAALGPAAAAAMPEWLWDLLGEAWPQQREAIAAASSGRPPMTLRVNSRRHDRAAFLATLQAAGIHAFAGEHGPDALTLETPRDVADIPGFHDGDASVQDENAQLAARLLAPRPGERILDGCAAPGGKTGHIAELLTGGQLLACDSSAERLQRVGENLSRLGLSAQLLCADLREPPAALTAEGLFDAMLLDVPCSATGVMRRHPDIKLLRRPSDIAGFAAQQSALLRGAWPLLKPGGRLLYVTCSLLPAENEEIVSAFLATHPDAAETPLSVPGAVARIHGAQCLPREGGGDGLYFAQLCKAAQG